MAPKINQNRHIKPENIIIFVPLNSFQDRLSQIVLYADEIDMCDSITRKYRLSVGVDDIARPLWLVLELCSVTSLPCKIKNQTKQLKMQQSLTLEFRNCVPTFPHHASSYRRCSWPRSLLLCKWRFPQNTPVFRISQLRYKRKFLQHITIQSSSLPMYPAGLLSFLTKTMISTA